MGVGANPAAWLVVVVFILTLTRMGLELGKETKMECKNDICRKAHTRTRRKARVNTAVEYLKSVGIAFVETLWAITASFVAGVVTLPIHAKGAPRMS